MSTWLLVCGSRTYSDVTRVFEELDKIHAENPVSMVIEGEAPGADTFGREWAMARKIPVAMFHADWEKYGRSAGPIRNREMLEKGKPDMVVAFVDKPLDQSRGTKNMVTISRKANIPVTVIGP